MVVVVDMVDVTLGKVARLKSLRLYIRSVELENWVSIESSRRELVIFDQVFLFT